MTKRKPVKMDDSDEDAVIEVGSDSDSDDNDFEVDVSDEAPSPVKPKSKSSVSAVKRHVPPSCDREAQNGIPNLHIPSHRSTHIQFLSLQTF